MDLCKCFVAAGTLTKTPARMWLCCGGANLVLQPASCLHLSTAFSMTFSRISMCYETTMIILHTYGATVWTGFHVGHNGVNCRRLRRSSINGRSRYQLYTSLHKSFSILKQDSEAVDQKWLLSHPYCSPCLVPLRHSSRIVPMVRFGTILCVTHLPQFETEQRPW